MTTSPRDRALLELADGNPPAWIVTPTRRLARALTIRVAELRAASGIEVADAPKIHSIDDWLRRLGQGVLTREAASGAAGRVLLSPHAERLLWEQVIRERTEDLPRDLLDVSALATTATQAWERLCLWGDPPWTDPMTLDVEAFRAWLPSFRAKLDAARFVTGGQLPALVAGAIRNGSLEEPLPERVATPSFERATPQLVHLVDALRDQGVAVLDAIGDEKRPPALPAVLRAATPSAELRTVASRIRSRLVSDPSARIAVLAPDPSAYGSRLERVFEEELDPASVVTIGASSRRRFDFAEAPMLADYALIASALDILGLAARRNDFEKTSRLLLCEFPRAEGEGRQDDPAQSERDRVRRGSVEAALRRERSASLRLAGGGTSIATALREAGLASRAAGFERLSKRLEADSGTRRAPSAWRREWMDRLKSVAWPGPLRGNIEGLVFRRWRDAIDEFAMLEVVQASMDGTEALRRLREICEQTPVQPASESHSVQVMNLLDAAGFEFDAIFAIGMTATAFPPPPSPNPLLPVRWQRAQPGMPRASVEAERELATRVWSRVLESAPEVVATYPALGDGNEENVASACLAGLPPQDVDRREGRAWWIDADRPALEARPAEAPVPPLVRRGSSAILRHQSDCAFHAFAAVRLGAEKLDRIQPQPDASRRGTLVHAALANAYRTISSSTDLAGLSDENIADAARVAATETVASDDMRSFFEDADDLAASAREWLTELVAAWMRHERDARDGTWEILEIEEDRVATFPVGAENPLTFRFRPDRIDRLENGSVVILDYKTAGTAKTSGAWNGDRPAEPQLPLYLALLQAADLNVDGIAFANLSARDKCELAGAGAREFAARFLPPGRKKTRTTADYDAAVAGYLTAVNGLAESFLRGDAQVDPRNSSVCRYCGAEALCRVRELRIGNEEEDDAGEGDE